MQTIKSLYKIDSTSSPTYPAYKIFEVEKTVRINEQAVKIEKSTRLAGQFVYLCQSCGICNDEGHIHKFG